MEMNSYRGFRSTKFVIAMATLCFGTIALFTNFITETVWAYSVVGLVVIYIGGDVGARVTEKLKAKGD